MTDADTSKPDITVTYVEAAHGHPYRVEQDGISVAANSPEAARALFRRILARRTDTPTPEHTTLNGRVIDLPTPDRVTLSDEERESLACVSTGHEPDLCDCNDAYRDNSDRFCEYAQETFAAVERILAAREAPRPERVGELSAALDRVRKLHDQDTGNLAAGDWCPGCGDREPCATKRAIQGETQ